MDIKSKIEAKNKDALERMAKIQPFLVDIELEAKNIIPDMDEKTILHAGPPIEWDRSGVLIY